MSDETTGKTIGITFIVSIVCSILVSAAAVLLRPIQEKNRELDKKRNVLLAAGLYKKGEDINELFKRITPKVINLQHGTIEKSLDPNTFNAKKILKDPKNIINLPREKDLAGIKKISRYSLIYFLKDKGKIQKIILPIYGKGLWSTLYGFIAIDRDLNTIRGFTFYEHGETPGLGGEVDNPRWKKIWQGKSLFNEKGEIMIRVLKGKVNPKDPGAKHQVDGLSGATLTSRGVSNLVRFWIGEDGFGTFLNNLQKTKNWRKFLK